MFSSEILAQEKTLDQAYDRLDSFNVKPTETSIVDFKNELSDWQPASSELQLAKVISLCNLGFAQSQFGQVSEAIQSYETAKLIFETQQLSRYDMVNSCYIPLGNLYTQTNAWSEAENQIKAYILEAENKGDTSTVVTGLLNLAVVFESAGNPTQAIVILNRALEFTPNDNRLLIRLATNQITTGKLDLATEITGDLLKNNSEKAEAHELHAKLLIREGNHKEALDAYKKALEILQKSKDTSPRRFAKAHMAVAETELTLQHLQSTKKHLQSVFKILIDDYSEAVEIPSEDQLYAENTLIDALDLQAKVFTSEEKPKKAYKCYQRAFFVSKILSEINSLQSTKLIEQSANKRRGEYALNLLFDLYQKTNDTIWITESLQLDQLVKAPVLLQAQRLQQQLFKHPESELTKKIQASQWQLAALQDQLDQVEEGKITHPDTVASIQNQFNILRLRQLELLNEFSENFSRIEPDHSISLSALQKKAAHHKNTLVSYFIGNYAIYQWVISEDTVQFKKISKTIEERDAFLDIVRKFNGFFQKAANIVNNPMQFAEVSNSLYNQLELPKAKRMVVIPDGILAFVPFSSLLVKPSQESSFGSWPYLLFESDVSYQVSLDGFLMSEKKLTKKPKVLGIFPVFKGTARELTYSSYEAEALSERMNTTLLMNEQATAQAFLKQSTNADIIHISTHAIGGTFTRSARIEFYDRDLTDTELYGYPFQKDLVVLSACETGVGMVFKGEGPQSIARAFQYAGTQNVLFSLWKVNDLSTAQLMGRFYSEVGKSQSYQNALHKAQIAFLEDETIDDLRKSPYYWAGFVYYGSTSTQSTSSPWYLWLLLPLGLLLSGVYLRKNRK